MQHRRKRLYNVPSFPGLLRGELEARARRYTPSTFVATGVAIADQTGECEPVPNPLDRRVHLAVTLAVARAAVAAGVARVTPDEEMLTTTFWSVTGALERHKRASPRLA